MKKVLYVGMDVHKESISIACASEGEEVRHYGTIPNHLTALDSIARKLVGTGQIPYFVYEAGPGGYTIYRHLRDNGLACMVAAPSLIPRKAGDRVKTDKRDAIMLARLLLAGELTQVHVPEAEDEAVRDMFRARCDAKQMERTAQQNLLSFLLRIGMTYTERHWTKMHFRWLAALSLPPTQQLVLQEYLDTIRRCRECVSRYDGMLRDTAEQWKREPDVRKLQSLRGVSFFTAVGIIAELGDLRRFKSARQLMAYAGLTPSENSSGEKIRRGGITRTGNKNVRWLLVESAWSYRLKARKSACSLKRQGGISAEVGELSWKAQVRLCGRYQRLLQKGKPKCKVIVSIARELAGFIWALGNISSQEEAKVKKAA
jgi:transposase